MESINSIAKNLLLEGKVSAVVGYAAGTLPGRSQTIIVRNAGQAEKLIFNEFCTNNLAVYLTKSYNLDRTKPVAVYAKPCDIRAIKVLIQEKQLKREEVFIIGVPCSGVSYSIKGELAPKCRTCQSHNPEFYDILAAQEVKETKQNNSSGDDDVKKIEDLPVQQRWDFWMSQFDKCLRCYACRQACPLCYCEQCIVDKTEPRWIDSSAHATGNLAWHLIRAFHLAGRCTGCGECERACHQNIPLGLLNKKMSKEIFELFGYNSGEDINSKPPLTDYRMEDNQEFIR